MELRIVWILIWTQSNTLWSLEAVQRGWCDMAGGAIKMVSTWEERKRATVTAQKPQSLETKKTVTPGKQQRDSYQTTWTIQRWVMLRLKRCKEMRWCAGVPTSSQQEATPRKKRPQMRPQKKGDKENKAQAFQKTPIITTTKCYCFISRRLSHFIVLLHIKSLTYTSHIKKMCKYLLHVPQGSCSLCRWYIIVLTQMNYKIFHKFKWLNFQ